MTAIFVAAVILMCSPNGQCTSMRGTIEKSGCGKSIHVNMDALGGEKHIIAKCDKQ